MDTGNLCTKVYATKETKKKLQKIDVVNVVQRLARDVDVAKRQFQNMQKFFTYIKNAFLKPILDWFSHMTHQIEA